MNTREITNLLDQEFRVRELGDPHLAKHALTDLGKAMANPSFIAEQSGLLFDFAAEVEKVYCTVFTTELVIEQILRLAQGPAMLFTHHPHDYHEDERGMGAFPESCLHTLRARGISVYAIHAPLDVGKRISVSASLANRLGLQDAHPFFEELEGHLGMAGMFDNCTLESLAARVCGALEIDSTDVFDYGGREGLVAVVAGGGDQVDILAQANDIGCTTYITGTAVHRWNRPSIQEGNRKFHDYAREHRINLIGASHNNTEKCAVQDVASFLCGKGVPASYLVDPDLDRYDIGNRRWKKGCN